MLALSALAPAACASGGLSKGDGDAAQAPSVRSQAADAPARIGTHTMRVGSITLRRCAPAGAYCGTIDRPIDSGGAIAGRISIYFEFYPHTGPGASLGTLVATEGGPGYPATESRDDYLALFGPLRSRRDVLIMDNRGTGRSGAIDCAALQTAERWTVEAVGACGKSLGDKAALYGTAEAADDLAALLRALRIPRIDLYGDSYGTYFEQVFAVRHPGRLRSLVLDGAYPLNGPDYAWNPTYAPAMRDKFNIACRRAEYCAALPGDSIDRVLPVLASLRAAPFEAHAADAEGRERAFTANASQLATVMFAGAPAFATVRELDAAARAFAGGDGLPLLRLMAETMTAVDSRDPTADARRWSAGLAAAVMCHDPPQIFDMRLPPASRIADRDRALAGRRRAFPETYAPFTIDEFRGMPLDYSFIDQCVEWPVAPAAHPAAQVAAADAAYPDVPALVISGEFDDMTTVAQGAAVARAFKRGRQIVIANSFHVNALPRARSPCAADLVRRFIGALDPGETGCAAAVPALRLVPRFARAASELVPATALTGNRAGAATLQVANAALQTVGDVLVRRGENSTGSGAGLRGGTFRIVTHGANDHVSLYGVRWTDDVTLDGAVERAPGPIGGVRARVRVTGPDGADGSLEMQWADHVPNAQATIHGTLRGAVVAAGAPAP